MFNVVEKKIRQTLFTFKQSFHFDDFFFRRNSKFQLSSTFEVKVECFDNLSKAKLKLVKENGSHSHDIHCSHYLFFIISLFFKF